MSLNKIFIINPKGEITQFDQQFYKKSYPLINEMVDMMFPSIEAAPEAKLALSQPASQTFLQEAQQQIG